VGAAFKGATKNATLPLLLKYGSKPCAVGFLTMDALFAFLGENCCGGRPGELRTAGQINKRKPS